MLQKKIDDWFKNEHHVAKYREGIEKLEESNIFEIFMRLGIPNLIDQGKDLNVQASQAAWSNGYQTCLEQMRYFLFLFAPKSIDPQNLQPDFGGIKDALKKGDLRKNEVDKG